LFFCCGPTGSGKTTTLHSVLGFLNSPDTKIWTVEDPVEITQKGLRQVQVNKKAGLDFASIMKSFLRADPDIIMVGEMRDKETTGTGIPGGSVERLASVCAAVQAGCSPGRGRSEADSSGVIAPNSEHRAVQERHQVCLRECL
jgi:energy-coupling factor transporter ATP-binding protein EcfA2